MHFTRILALAALVLTQHAQADSLEISYLEAVKVCTVLSPGHESELGNGDPDEVAWWLKGARLNMSTAFWNRRGVAFLERRLNSANQEVERVCVRQLLAEAHAKEEVPPDFSSMPTP